jgi:hypothetical protein
MLRNHIEFSAPAKYLPAPIHALPRMALNARLFFDAKIIVADLPDMALFTFLAILVMMVTAAVAINTSRGWG